MRKYIWGLGTTTLIETDCDEIEEYLSTFYYLTNEVENFRLENKFSISRCGRDYLLIINGEEIPISKRKLLPYLNYCIIDRCCMTELKNSIYLHSSGFVYEDKIFLFFNSSGSGKTTFAAYCLKNHEKKVGFLGDDVIRVDLQEKKVYGLACGMRIKQGTKELYFREEDMYEFIDEEASVWVYRPQNEIVKVAPYTNEKQVYFINIKYTPSSEKKVEEVSGMDKIQMIMNNTYHIQDNKRNIFNLIPALSGFQFYTVEYSDTEDLMNSLLQGKIAENGR